MSIKDLIIYNEYPNFPMNGVNFIDLTPSLLNTKNRAEIVKQMIQLYFADSDEISKEVDYIISPDARGFIWGSMIASKFELGFIPVRKPGKLPDKAILSSVDYETEYSTTKLCMPVVDLCGKKLLFVDDIYATGGTYKAVKQMVNQNNGILIGGVVLVDVELDKNDEVKSLAKIRDLKRGA
jgi:adenine phosphoribosyltransferase